MATNVIIAGSRYFDDYELLELHCNAMLKDMEDVVLLCGMARGADELGAVWARKYGIEIKEFPADWHTYGKSAGYRRTAEMVAEADRAICFWDGASKGAKFTIDQMRKAGKPVYVVRY